MPSDDSESRIIAAMRLSGQRFKSNGMPADSLAEVAALEDILRTLVRQFWLDRNPSRQRVPAGYDSEITLRLTRIGEGSSVPVLEHDRELGKDELFREGEVKDDYARALDIVGQFIEYAETGSGSIPPEMRSVPSAKIKKFGQTLHRDDAIQIAHTDQIEWKTVIRYTPATRAHALGQLLGVYTEQVTVEGRVTKFDTERGRLTVRDRERGNEVVVPYLHTGVNANIGSDEEQHFECVAEGIGEFKANGRLVRLESISSLDLNDVTEDARAVRQLLNDLADLEEGWIDGDSGEPISPEVIERGHAVVLAMIELGNITRVVSPTEEGGVRFYWHETENQLSIEVEPSRALYIHTADLSAGTFADARVPPDADDLTDRLNSWLAEEHFDE
ncbi:hypothetical protein [Nocardia aurea]|uniref:hypothetical protein n=1 Tax=Nocardia aurea TaxID=2144174 RepID=UPI000D695A20|nr:hypothetical protein [Nocardia aurea]